MFKLFVKCSLLFLLSCAVSKAYAQDILTLEEAVQIGLQHNFSIRIAQNDLQISRNDVTLGNAGFLPQLAAVASRDYTIQDTERQFIERPRQDIDNARSNVTAASLDLNWTIFDGMRMFITLEKLRELQKAGELNAKLAVEASIAEIYNAYYRIVLEEEQLKVLENTVELSNERLRIAQALYEVGKGAKLQYLSAQVDLNADQSAFIQQQETIYSAKVDLNNLIGRRTADDFNVVNDIIISEKLIYDDLYNSLLISNTNLQFARKSSNIAALEVREIRSQRLPTLTARGGYEYRNLNAEAGFLLQDRSVGFYYGLTAAFNIFNGSNQSRQIQNAKVLGENANLQYEALELQVESDLRKRFQSYNNSLQLLELENANLELARESTAIALDRYKLGRSTSLELREAQRNEVDAESRALNAAYALKIAEIEILRLTGKILQTFPEYK